MITLEARGQIADDCPEPGPCHWDFESSHEPSARLKDVQERITPTNATDGPVFPSALRALGAVTSAWGLR